MMLAIADCNAGIYVKTLYRHWKKVVLQLSLNVFVKCSITNMRAIFKHMFYGSIREDIEKNGFPILRIDKVGIKIEKSGIDWLAGFMNRNP